MIVDDRRQPTELELIDSGGGLDEFGAEGNDNTDPRPAVGREDHVLLFASETGDVSALPIRKDVTTECANEADIAVFAVDESKLPSQLVPPTVARMPRFRSAMRQAALCARRGAIATGLEIRYRVHHKGTACLTLAADTTVAIGAWANGTRETLSRRAIAQAPAVAGIVVLAAVSSGGLFVGMPRLADEPPPMPPPVLAIDAGPALSVTMASALPARMAPTPESRSSADSVLERPRRAPQPRTTERRAATSRRPVPRTPARAPAREVIRTASSEPPAPPAPKAPEAARAVSAPAAIDPSAAHRSAVGEVLASYRRSYNNLDASSVATIWQGADVKALRRAFASLSSQRLTFDSCDVSVTSADRARARCNGQLNYVPRFGDTVPQQRRVEWTMDLARAADRWMIVDLSAR